jgi:hypothetical protein
MSANEMAAAQYPAGDLPMPGPHLALERFLGFRLFKVFAFFALGSSCFAASSSFKKTSSGAGRLR